jgi:tRNA threonylcarbamoyladenosine biosynthesis protein TsaB
LDIGTCFRKGYQKMALILHIDTATERASVSIAGDGNLLQERVNNRAMDHAAWIHTAIREMIDSGNSVWQLTDIKAVAVVAGPGSYTGLRVGMATAKGLCYALNIPLISLNTLELMAYAMKEDAISPELLCPMLDARRQEVFTALYNFDLEALVPPCAMVLESNSFADYLKTNRIVFSGNGSPKWKLLLQHENAVFRDVFYTAGNIAIMAAAAFSSQAFSDIAYTDPIYLKDFYSYHP